MEMIGRVVGNYRIVEKIGEGGMGQVFRAQHLRLEREVAIKALVSPSAVDGQVRDRMIREQQILDQLHHAHIVALHDIQFEPNAVFLVMELVRGENLEAYLARRGALPPDRVVHVARQILEALALAHSKGIVHRDIKPGNIMVLADGSGVKLLDFGIARATDSAGLTRTGTVLGSPAYLPPERWEDGAITPATDIYALGLCLHEALTGRPALHTSGGWHEYYRLHLRGQIPDPAPLCPAAPAWLCAAIRRATRVDPRERYPDAAAMLAEFSAVPAPAPGAHWTEQAAGALDRPGQVRGEKTRAFLAQAQRPWRRVSQGLAAAGGLAFLGIIGGSLLIAAGLVGYALLHRTAPPVFVLELANEKATAVELVCSAGAGEQAREWRETIGPGSSAAMKIPAFPASCWEQGADGRSLVWTTPVWAAIAAPPKTAPRTAPAAGSADADLAAARVVPEDEQRAIMGIKAPRSTRATGTRPAAADPGPARARVFLGAAPSAPSRACDDLVALEPQAMLGQLPPDVVSCLESAIESDPSLTADDKRSRLLIANAYGRNDQIGWERLVRRHLEEISLGDPELCLLYATHMSRKTDAAAKAEAIKYANYGLENKDKLAGESFAKRVGTMHQVRAVAALDLWERYDRQYIKDRSPETEAFADKARGLAKEYAREWYEFTSLAGGDPKPALAACRSASGSDDFCR